MVMVSFPNQKKIDVTPGMSAASGYHGLFGNVGRKPKDHSIAGARVEL